MRVGGIGDLEDLGTPRALETDRLHRQAKSAWKALRIDSIGT